MKIARTVLVESSGVGWRSRQTHKVRESEFHEICGLVEITPGQEKTNCENRKYRNLPD